MFDLHIEDFYKDCAKALLSLYVQFPRKGMLFVEDIAGPDTPDEYGVHAPRFESGFGTLLWLAEQGYIEYEATIRQEGLDQVILSAKGLHMLACICHDDYLLELVRACSPAPVAHDQALAASKAPAASTLAGQPTVNILRYISKHGTSTQVSLVMQHLLSLQA